MQVVENMIKALQRLAIALAALSAVIIFACLPVAAYDGPFLTGCARWGGREVLVFVKDSVGFPYSFSDKGAAWVVDRSTGEFVHELFSPRMAKEVIPDESEWDIMGVDGRCRVYLGLRSWEVVVVDGLSVQPVEMRSIVRTPVTWDTGDDFIVGATRFWHPGVGPCVYLARITPAPHTTSPWIDTWEIPSYSYVDIPACNLAVSPDGNYVFVSEEMDGAAWIWDAHAALHGVIGFCYSRYDLDRFGIEPESLAKLERAFVTIAWGVFDRQDRLMVYQNGKMWGYNVDGRLITTSAGFELRSPDGEAITPRGYVFAPWDNHMFVSSEKDGLIYEFDISPVFEKELDELHGLWFPGQKPPIFIRCIEPESLPAL